MYVYTSNVQGVYPPLPKRSQDTIGGTTLTHQHTCTHTHTHTHTLTGFSAVIAAGPFSTSDSLDMAPLDDLIAMVMEAGPDILLLVTTHHYIIELLLFSQMGPFVDINNSIVKVCN